MNRKSMWHTAAGTVYGVVVCLLSLLLIRNLSLLFGLLSGLFAVDAKTTEHISAVLAQLRHSSIDAPWIVMILFGGCVGWLLSLIPGRKRIWITLVLAVFLLLPLVLVAVWFSCINGVMAGDLVMSLLQWL